MSLVCGIKPGNEWSHEGENATPEVRIKRYVAPGICNDRNCCNAILSQLNRDFLIQEMSCIGASLQLVDAEMWKERRKYFEELS